MELYNRWQVMHGIAKHCFDDGHMINENDFEHYKSHLRPTCLDSQLMSKIKTHLYKIILNIHCSESLRVIQSYKMLHCKPSFHVMKVDRWVSDPQKSCVRRWYCTITWVKLVKTGPANHPQRKRVANNETSINEIE